MRHPLHPAIVHFPVACWTLAVASDVCSIWFGEAAWHWSSGLLAVGCAMAFIAALAGLLEISGVSEGAAMRDLWVHMAAMLLASTFFTVRLLIRLDHLNPLAPDLMSFALDAGGLIALAVGGWFGGRLVYGHGVGVSRK